MVVILLVVLDFPSFSLLSFSENLGSATCTLCASACASRRSYTDSQKFGSITTSLFPSSRAYPRAKRGKNGTHVLQAVYCVTRRTFRCCGSARTSPKLHHRHRERKLGRRYGYVVCTSSQFTNTAFSEIIVHNAGRRSHIAKIPGAHKGKISGLCWADENRILSCGVDRNIKMWNVYQDAQHPSEAGQSQVRFSVHIAYALSNCLHS